MGFGALSRSLHRATHNFGYCVGALVRWLHHAWRYGSFAGCCYPVQLSARARWLVVRVPAACWCARFQRLPPSGLHGVLRCCYSARHIYHVPGGLSLQQLPLSRARLSGSVPSGNTTRYVMLSPALSAPDPAGAGHGVPALVRWDGAREGSARSRPLTRPALQLCCWLRLFERSVAAEGSQTEGSRA